MYFYYRIVITAILLVHKMYSDFYYDNCYVGRVGGLQSCQEITLMEAHFIRGLDFNLFISEEEYTHFFRLLFE